jgi:hypothetical protein
MAELRELCLAIDSTAAITAASLNIPAADPSTAARIRTAALRLTEEFGLATKVSGNPPIITVSMADLNERQC